MSSIAVADEWDSLPKDKVTKLGLYMHPVDAFKCVSEHKNSTLFLDVRTREEVQFMGMSTVVDANVPFMQNPPHPVWNDTAKNFQMVLNPDFADGVEQRLKEKALTKNDVIILMCRSGSRSTKAANLLGSLGYTKVYSLPEGFEGDMVESGPNNSPRAINGWKKDGLQWSNELDKRKMYRLSP